MARAGVSQNMKRLGIVVAIAAIALCVWYLRKPHKSTAAPDEPKQAAGSAHRPDRPAAIDHVQKLPSAERKQLADRIAAAQAERKAARPSTGGAAISAPAAPRLPDNLPDEPAISKTQFRDAMREVIPIITECYTKALPTLAEPNIDVLAKIRVTGDPDIGSIIDTDQVTFKDGAQLPAKFDECLRDTFSQLALPPLAEGDVLEVHYPFRFEND
ncbi:MAG TPA: hypothetical protein VL326_19430 [Kofleriaceae bacterium]|nr:hypothetical protein [Kofleriaceae bacterium]